MSLRLSLQRTLAGAAMCLAAAPLFGQSEPATPQIRVTGRATVSARPDQADVDIGVVTEATDAERAARLNAEKLDSVRQAILAAVGAETKLETLNYSLQPVYRRSTEPRDEPTVSGYRATNVLRIKALGLDSIGKVIDVATGSGANTISNIAFGLKNEDELKARALREAALDARSKVTTLASALGLEAGRILSVTEGEPDVIRPMSAFRGELAMAQSAATTPIEPNAIEVRASVTLVVEIAP